MLKIQNNLSGFLLVYKEKGVTSFSVVKEVKKALNIKKVGHCGTLDPLAEGLIVIAIGEATKLVNYVMSKNKTYKFKIRFGILTKSYDMGSEIIEENNYLPSNIEIEKALPKFIGKIKQLPPIFSAIKINGTRAYALARQNIDIEMKPREIEVFDLKLLAYNKINKEAEFIANVSSGSYIRSLGVDIAKSLNAIATVVTLERICLGIKKDFVSISSNRIYTLAEKLKPYLIDMENMLDDIPAYYLTPQEAVRLMQGIAPSVLGIKEGIVKALYQNKLLALLKITKEKISFVRVFNQLIDIGGL